MTSSEKNLESIFTFKFKNKESKPKNINLMEDKFLIFFDNNSFIYIINTNNGFDIFKGNLENLKNVESTLISLSNINSENYFLVIKNKEGDLKAITLNPKLNKSSEVKLENENSISDIIIDNNNTFYVIRKSGSKGQFTIESFYFLKDNNTNDKNNIPINKSIKIISVDLFNNDNIKSIKGNFDDKFTTGNIIILTNFNHIKNIQIENEVKKQNKNKKKI